MAGAALSYWDYVKAAFSLKVPLPALGPMPLNKLALAGFAILGVAHPGIWFLGLAFEAAYLLYLPGNPRFQTLTRGMSLLEMKKAPPQKDSALLAALSPDAKRRFGRLSENCGRILRLAESSVSGKLEELSGGDLNELLWVFLKLLASKQKIADVLESTDQDEIRKEIDELSAKVGKDADASAIGRSLKATLEIQKRRLENLERAKESLKVAEAELDRIEKQVSLLAEETAIGSSPEALSTRLDGVMQSIQGTSQWMSQHSEFFTTLDDAAPPNLLEKPEE